jgi:hypothetical protein
MKQSHYPPVLSALGLAAGYLAQYAHQLFDELHAEAKTQEMRIKAVASRAKSLLEAVSAGETAVGHRRAMSIAPLSVHEVQVHMGPMNGFFSGDTKPWAIRNKYSSPLVGALPDFGRLDQIFGDAQTPCAVNYSYPGAWWSAKLSVVVSGALPHESQLVCPPCRILLQRVEAS